MAAVVSAEAIPAMDGVQEKTAAQANTTASKPPSVGPPRTPPAAPQPGCKPLPRPELTADQQTKYEWLLAQVRGWSAVPKTVKTAALHGSKHYPAAAATDDMAPLADVERLWLTRECLLRYLRATKWHEPEAEKRLLATLAWRREYGVDGRTADDVVGEMETGKQVIMGFDKDCRPCFYLMPGRQNTTFSPRQVQSNVFMMERVLELMPLGVENIALLVDHAPSKTRANTTPPLSQAREVLNILQNHYPERLGKAISVNLPWVVYGFYKLITPFMDPMTRDKLKLNDDVTKYVPREILLTNFGGDLDNGYDHDAYWPALLALCEERRAGRRQRWAAGGSQIGELEDYLAGGLEAGIGAPAPESVPEAQVETLAEATEAMKLTESSGEKEATEEAKEDAKTEEAPAPAA